MPKIEVNASDILKGIDVAGSIMKAARDWYHESRRIAASAGVSKEDLDAADRRYGFDYIPPPPALQPPLQPTQPPPQGLYDTPFDTQPPDSNYKAGDRVMWATGGEFIVWKVERKLVSGEPPVIGAPGWELHHVVGQEQQEEPPQDLEKGPEPGQSAPPVVDI